MNSGRKEFFLLANGLEKGLADVGAERVAPRGEVHAFRTEGREPDIIGEGVDGNLRPQRRGPEIDLHGIRRHARDEGDERVVDRFAVVTAEFVVKDGRRDDLMAEEAAAEAEEAGTKNTEQALRRLRQMAQIIRLAELCDRAGLADDINISVKSWQKITAGALRRLAENGLGKEVYFWHDDYDLLNSTLRDLEKLAERLNCTVGELAGEDPQPMSKSDTSPWKHDIPKESGHYLGKYGRNTEVIYFDAEKQEWRDYQESNYSLDNVRAWMEIPEED